LGVKCYETAFTLTPVRQMSLKSRRFVKITN